MSALTEALVLAQGDLPTAVPRDSQGLGYRYTSLDALIAATRPILTKHGIAITQQPSYVQVGDHLRPVLVTRLECGDDSSLFETPLYVTEQTSQGFGTAVTYARRYAWASALGIASEEDTDAVAIDRSGEEIPF